MATSNLECQEAHKTKTPEEYEKIAKILMVDFDNTPLQNITPHEEKELKIWKEIIKNSEHWYMLCSFDCSDESARAYFETLPYENRKSYFMFGVACMLSFVQANFTGPNLKPEFTKFFETSLFRDEGFSEYLSRNFERINPNTKLPFLLTAAKLIFRNCNFHSLVNVWWCLRATLIHQLIIDELCPSLLNDSRKLMEEIHGLKVEGHTLAKLEIEQAQLMLIYRQIAVAKKHISMACDLLGVNFDLREKTSEEEELSLSLVDVEGIKRPRVYKLPVPKDVVGNNTKYPLVSNTEQKLILTIVQHMVLSSPQEELPYKKLRPYFNLLLSQNNTWPVRTAALLFRTQLEFKYLTEWERCSNQLQEIMKYYQAESPHPLTRIGGVYGTSLQPIWKTETQLADTLYKRKKISAAYEMYHKLEAWDRVASCVGAAKTEKKIQFMRKKFKDSKEDVRFLCYEGDLTQDTACYDSAWNLSKKRSFRCQRHWAIMLFNQNNFQEAIPHFSQSLSMNFLQFDLWKMMGLAAIKCDQWKTAVTAFQRYTQYEPEGFECWNYLATAYTKTDNNTGAHQALSEALRCKNDDPVVWEDFIYMSAQIKHFYDIFRAYTHLLNVKGKYLNTEVLDVLVHGIKGNMNDALNRPSGHLLAEAQSLFGRLVPLYQTEPLIWELYGAIAPNLNLKVQRFLRAFTCYSEKNNWQKDPDTCRHVLFVCFKLANVALNPKLEGRDQLVATIRTTLSTAISIIKKQDHDETKNSLAEITTLLARLIDKCKLASRIATNKK